MADFNEIYPTIVKYEGYYVNDPKDPGGETYMGIARNYNPGWAGWKIIDNYKLSKGGTIPYNTHIPSQELDNLVKQRAYEYFIAMRGNQINNLAIATIAAQLFWGTASGVKRVVQQAAINLGAKISADNVIGPNTINALNTLPSQALYNEMRRLYINYVDILGKGQPEYAIGWKNRLNYVLSLTDKWISNNGLPILGLLLGSMFIYLAMKN